MKDYTYQDMLKMQEEAAVRVREMKKRAAIAVEEDEKESAEAVKPVFPDEVRHISYPVELPEPVTDKSAVNDEKKSGLLDIIKADSDSVLILFILLLLSQEETDYITSLALLYLLM